MSKEKEITREEKITATKMFMELHSADEIAEFIINQNDAIDGLRKNNDSFRESYLRIESIRSSRDEWKADAERLASLVEQQRNAYDMMGCEGVTGITDEGYLKLERALIDHKSLAEKDKKSWGELTKQVLEENRGAWKELGKE
jgi:hypothetical protein